MPSLMESRAERIAALNYDYASQPKVQVNVCNLCGESQWVQIVHRDRYGFPASASSCAHCGCTQLRPRMTSEAYSEFYQSVYRPLVSAYHGRTINAVTVQNDQIPYTAAMVELLAPFVNQEWRTFLDIGGSTGVIAKGLRDAYGWQGTIIDPAPAETAVAEAAGLESITGFAETHDFGARNFDVIGLFQTIDHLLDIQATLTKVRNLISPHGLFAFDIVDFRAAYLRNHSLEEAVKIDHVYSLTQEVTEAYLVKSGFRWIEKSYSADHLHVVYLCKPTEATKFEIPDPTEYFREIRWVQNSPS